MITVQDNIKEISGILQTGGVILYPTDTIWGLGCDATNEKAIQAINRIKKRKPGKPLIILVNSVEMLKEYVPDVHPRVETLLLLHKRPLTVIHSKYHGLPSILSGGQESIGVRIVQDDFCQELISDLGVPIVSTSANVATQPAPRHFGEITSDIFKRVDYVVRYRQEDKTTTEPSVIVTYDENGELVFLRT